MSICLYEGFRVFSEHFPGVEFLSLVLANCTPESLTEKTSAIALHRLLPIMNPSDLAHRLSVFYCSKLEDTETIIPALKGLISLAKLSSCTAEDAIIIVKAYDSP